MKLAAPKFQENKYILLKIKPSFSKLKIQKLTIIAQAII